MGKQQGIFKCTGKLDNVIGYRRNGVYCVRTMPEKVRQTAAARRAAQRFGIASRKGKLIGRAVLPLNIELLLFSFYLNIKSFPHSPAHIVTLPHI